MRRKEGRKDTCGLERVRRGSTSVQKWRREHAIFTSSILARFPFSPRPRPPLPFLDPLGPLTYVLIYVAVRSGGGVASVSYARRRRWM